MNPARTQRWLDRPLPDWGYAAEAFLLLGLARMAIRFIPLRSLSPHLGTPNQESPATLAPESLPQLHRIAWALEAAARRTPWQSTCLARALSGRVMLHRRGISSTLTLGLDSQEAGRLQAHAWLRSGDLLVAGAQEQAQFTAVASFADLTGSGL